MPPKNLTKNLSMRQKVYRECRHQSKLRLKKCILNNLRQNSRPKMTPLKQIKMFKMNPLRSRRKQKRNP